MGASAQVESVHRELMAHVPISLSNYFTTDSLVQTVLNPEGFPGDSPLMLFTLGKASLLSCPRPLSVRGCFLLPASCTEAALLERGLHGSGRPAPSCRLRGPVWGQSWESRCTEALPPGVPVVPSTEH